MGDEHLSRGAALAYRAAAQQLDRPARGIPSCAVLGVGVQDTPPGTTARVALAARLPSEPDLATARSLVLVHSVRGTMHVHRKADLPLLAAALRPDDAADLLRQAHGGFFADAAAAGVPVGEAFDEVAARMAEVMADGRRRSKGELSSALNEVVDKRLRPWCAGCGVHHVHDGLFRMASLPAGLELRPAGDGSADFVRLSGRLDPADPAPARRELVRRYLRLTGPASHATLAAWLGVSPGAARRWWDPLADDLVPVRVDGRLFRMHGDDLAAARDAVGPDGVRLLPPYDPLLALADRELLLPAQGDRRRLWKTAANPGAVLVRGEVAGAWRRRRGVVTVEPFGALTAAVRRALEEAAGTEVVVS